MNELPQGESTTLLLFIRRYAFTDIFQLIIIAKKQQQNG